MALINIMMAFFQKWMIPHLQLWAPGIPWKIITCWHFSTRHGCHVKWNSSDVTSWAWDVIWLLPHLQNHLPVVETKWNMFWPMLIFVLRCLQSFGQTYLMYFAASAIFSWIHHGDSCMPIWNAMICINNAINTFSLYLWYLQLASPLSFWTQTFPFLVSKKTWIWCSKADEDLGSVW